MSAPVAAGELERAYEAVRAQATGAAPQSESAPGGLALLLDRGIAAWIAVVRSSVPSASSMAPSASWAAPLLAATPRWELASVLTEMALASHRRLSA